MNDRDGTLIGECDGIFGRNQIMHHHIYQVMYHPLLNGMEHCLVNVMGYLLTIK